MRRVKLNMIKFKFLKILFFIGIALVFVKIYQHNQVVRITYEKQRLERKKQDLVKEKNELLIRHAFLKDYKKVKQYAQDVLKMRKLLLSQVITLTTKSYE